MIFSESMRVRLLNQHHSLRELVAGLTNFQWEERPAPGKWNIHEQLAHLAAYQPVFHQRMEKIREESRPAFGRYVADEDPFFKTCCAKENDQLLNMIDSDRELINHQLQSLLATEASREGIHPLFGSLTIVDWTEFFLLHEAHHLFSIWKLAHQLKPV